MKILVIDDDALIRRSFQYILSRKGHEVMIAANGLEASELILNHVPDIIFCDMMMPEVSGLTFIQMLRGELKHEIPVVIISTLDKGGVIASNLGMKNIDFMLKPIHSEELIRKVNNYSKNRNHENSNPAAVK